MLHRGVDAPLEEGKSAPDRWLLYVEMKGASGAGEAGGEESLRVWLGAFGRAPIVLKVLPDGR